MIISLHNSYTEYVIFNKIVNLKKCFSIILHNNINGYFINSEKNKLPGHKIPIILLFTTCITCCCVSVLICLYFLCVICTDLGFELCSYLFKILISKNEDLRFYWLFCNYSSKAFILVSTSVLII